MLFSPSRPHHFSFLSTSLSCYSAPLLFSCLLSTLLFVLHCADFLFTQLVGSSFAPCWRRRAFGSGGLPAGDRVRPSIRATRLHVGPSCCRSRLVRLSFNRRRRSRRVAAICVRGICAAAAARAAVECWAAAWGAGRNRGSATITITHSIQASRTSHAYSAASRGAATAAATGRTAIAAVGSARQRRCTRAR